MAKERIFGSLRSTLFANFLTFYKSYDNIIYIKVLVYNQSYRMEVITWSHDVANIFYSRKRNLFSILAKETPEYVDFKLDISLILSFFTEDFDFRGR